MSEKIHALSTVTQIENLIYIPAFFFFYITAVSFSIWRIKPHDILVCFVFQGEEGEGKKSILDVDPEVQAIMEMTGKTLHSQGLREPEEEQEQWG